MPDSHSFPATKVNVTSLEPPLISVIVAVHNEAPYIVDVLKSIVGNDYQNIELIIVNDGSVDGSERLAAEFLDEVEAQNPALQCLLLTKICNNKYLALGVGIAHARGDIVFTLDADTPLKANSLLKMSKKFGVNRDSVIHQHIASHQSVGMMHFRDRIYRVPQPVSRMVHKAYMRVGIRSSK